MLSGSITRSTRGRLFRQGPRLARLARGLPSRDRSRWPRSFPRRRRSAPASRRWPFPDPPAPVPAARGPASPISARTSHADIVLNLAFQLLDQRLQFGDEGVLLGHHRLFVLACRTLDGPRTELLQRCSCAAKAFTTSGGRSGNWLRSKGCDMRLPTRVRTGKPNKTTPKQPR